MKSKYLRVVPAQRVFHYIGGEVTVKKFSSYARSLQIDLNSLEIGTAVVAWDWLLPGILLLRRW